MFGFKRNKDIEKKDIPVVPSSMEVLKTKCRVSTIGQSEYLIANDLDALSAEECSLLYKSWEDEFRKSSLFKRLLDRNLLYFIHDTPVIKEQFNRLNINELQIMYQTHVLNSESQVVNSTSHNPRSSSGLLLSYDYSSDRSSIETSLTIMNADKKILLSLDTSYNSKYSSLSRDAIQHFIPGPWLSILNSDLDRIPEFRKEIVAGDDLIKAQAQRGMIYDAMQMN